MDNFYEPAISLFPGMDTTVAAFAATTGTVGSVVSVRSCSGTFSFLQASFAGEYPWYFSAIADAQFAFTAFHEYIPLFINKFISVSGKDIFSAMPGTVRIFCKPIPKSKKEVYGKSPQKKEQTVQMIPILNNEIASF